MERGADAARGFASGVCPVASDVGVREVAAPYGSMLAVDAGSRVVCHLCGEALAAVLAQHARRHGLTLADYRERFGLNGKQ